MKVRYVAFHAYGVGGTIRSVVNQANAMAAAGHQVELVSVVRRRDQPTFPIARSVTLVDLVDDRRRRASTGRVGKLVRRLTTDRPSRLVPRGEPARAKFTRRVTSAIVAYFRGLDGGILVTSRPALNLLSARFCPPAVIRVGQEHMHFASHKPEVGAAIRKHYGSLTAVVTLTARDRDRYQAEIGDQGVVVTAIPNAIPLAHARPASLDQPLVVAAGRLTTQKGFDLLIEAFGEVSVRAPDWQLRIYGNGPKRQELQQLIDDRHLGHAVQLMGRSRTLATVMVRSSIFVLSSRYEGMPMVVLEAMAHGLPVVSFDCPTGPRELITNGVDGILVPAGDVRALASAIGRLIRDERTRRELGAAARRRVDAYSTTVIMPRWEALFADLQSKQNAGDDDRGLPVTSHPASEATRGRTRSHTPPRAGQP